MTLKICQEVIPKNVMLIHLKLIFEIIQFRH